MPEEPAAPAASAAPAEPAIRVVVRRSEPTARREFPVARAGARIVLDLLARAARVDPTLAYRYSCRSGYCGTCTITIDGRPGLACQTPVPAEAAAVHLGPLAGFPVVRDLIIDPAPFATRWAAADARLEPSLAAGSATRDSRIDESLDCLSCGACVAACDVAATNPAFIGPAALNRAFVVIGDARDAHRATRLAQVGDEHGIDGCRGIGACSLACPRGLDPSRSIRRLRRLRLTGVG